jgi:Ca2+-transporting ATPase
MSSIYTKDNVTYIFSKGAPELLLEKCDRILINGEIKPFDDNAKSVILQQNESFANNALRVLGFAYKTTNEKTNPDEQNLIFVGLQAMIDPPREEVKAAIMTCKKA